jgi:hypothetical protein
MKKFFVSQTKINEALRQMSSQRNRIEFNIRQQKLDELNPW